MNATPEPQAPTPSSGRTQRQSIGLVLGAVLFLILQAFPPPAGLAREGWVVASLALLMACWWVSEALPIAVTALLPLVILPLFGVSSFGEAARGYAHPVVMLLLGGFIIAKGVERWNLHARVALTIVARAGSRPDRLVLGFMAASALLSMWISNTATTLMMTPIALSVAHIITGGRPFGAPVTYCLLLGIAYAASIGGLGTPIGTPTNLIVMGFLQDDAGVSISFQQWMAFGAPVVIVLVPVVWLLLTRVAFPMRGEKVEAAADHVDSQLKALGPLSTPETRTLAVFALIALLWVFGRSLQQISIGGVAPFGGLTDHVTAILGAILFFLVPAGGHAAKGEMLLDWDTAASIPWGVYLLFGGGLSLASAISSTGLALWLGEQLSWVNAAPSLIIVLILVVFVIAATELVSNVAAASALMPVILAIAAAGDHPAVLLAAPVALASSCAFMLPMATGPNAIVFASGHVPLTVMARAGFQANLAAAFLITGMGAVLAPLVLGS